MTAWFTTPETTPRATCPNETFVRFAAKNFKPPARFLDIGSGSGANSCWLMKQNHYVVAVDSAFAAPPAGHIFLTDLSDALSSPPFDCIFDINTLCHVEDPPYEAIYKALKPGGIFFSIHPADDTEADLSGKGYTRRADQLTMRKLLGRGFNKFTVLKDVYHDGNKRITSWQIRAEKAGVAQ